MELEILHSWVLSEKPKYFNTKPKTIITNQKNQMKLEKPKNRKAEVFFLMINSEWFNYYTIGRQLNNLNVHRVRDYLEEKCGIRFETRFKPFKNRFGRLSRIKEFKIVSNKAVINSAYHQLNKRKKK